MSLTFSLVPSPKNFIICFFSFFFYFYSFYLHWCRILFLNSNLEKLDISYKLISSLYHLSQDSGLNDKIIIIIIIIKSIVIKNNLNIFNFQS